MIHTIVAFSDSHQKEIPERLLNIFEESEYVFFLGDGDNKNISELAFHPGFHGVCGNCDVKALPEEDVVEIDGVRILLTHGDKYHVKRDLNTLLFRAKELNCSVVFYGHTHFAEIDRFDDITFVCPGALSNCLSGNPSYAYATIVDGKFLVKIVPLA